MVLELVLVWELISARRLAALPLLGARAGAEVLAVALGLLHLLQRVLRDTLEPLQQI